MLFGVFLGGIWADQAWGRFWGWDPKDSSSLIIVLWLLILVHLHKKHQPLFFSTVIYFIILNIVILFSWIGVNFLNNSLHNY